MYCSDREILNNLVYRRNLTYKTKQGYKNALDCYTSYNGMLFIELLKEAENDEEKGIR